MKNKRIAIINSYNCGSTGKIACKIGDFARKEGYEVLKCFPKHTINITNKKEDHYLFGSPLLFKFNSYLTEITGLHGFFQFYNTRQLIKKLKVFNPQLIHLHNLHSSYVNLKILFKYIKKNNIKVVWTLHDCWAFTGHCAYFSMSGCEKWMHGCEKCTNHAKEYPKAFIDTSKIQWNRKKQLFTSINDLTLITPSIWLNNLVKQSFLYNKKCMLIRNGIDLDIFKPTDSGFRKAHNLSNNTIIILGVAFGWNYRKGLDVFVELSKILPPLFKIVLVGTNDIIDKSLPSNILSIHRTHNQNELAEIYSAANVFLNPTREEMLGMTNIEANACGTPVITFDTDGSPECINEKSGVVYKKENSINDLKDFIIRFVEDSTISSDDCIENSQRFNEIEKYKEYVILYNKIVRE